MQIIVKGVSGKSKVCEVERSDSIMCLKKKIQLIHGIPMEDQRLIYSEKQLHQDHDQDDDAPLTLAHYNILNGSMVEVVGRLRGGGYGKLNYPPTLLVLAQKYKQNKKVCRKCYARLPLKAQNCRKKKCGHSNDLRLKKLFQTKYDH